MNVYVNVIDGQYTGFEGGVVLIAANSLEEAIDFYKGSLVEGHISGCTCEFDECKFKKLENITYQGLEPCVIVSGGYEQELE